MKKKKTLKQEQKNKRLFKKYLKSYKVSNLKKMNFKSNAFIIIFFIIIIHMENNLVNN
jgi:hypothetical protein